MLVALELCRDRGPVYINPRFVVSVGPAPQKDLNRGVIYTVLHLADGKEPVYVEGGASDVVRKLNAR